MGWLWMLLMELYLCSGALITFWYPLIASFVAIGSSKKTDDKLWITYWMLYALVATVELIVPFITWIPGYALIKTAVATWLVLPQSRGAIVVYDELVSPHFNFCFNYMATEVTFTDGERQWSAYLKPDTNANAALYIKEKGTEAFELLLKSATDTIKVENGVKVEKVEKVEEIKSRA